MEQAIKIPAITIHEPYAELIRSGIKTIEVRKKGTKYRGPILIHAGLKMDKKALADLAHLLPMDRKVPLGAIVCLVDLVDVFQFTLTLWEAKRKNHCVSGRFEGFRKKSGLLEWPKGWVLKNPRIINPPIPAKGKQSFWYPEISGGVEKSLRPLLGGI